MSCSCLLLIPRNNILKLDTTPAENIQCTTNGKVDASVAQFLHQLQVFNRSAAAGVGDGDAAPLSQLRDELVVDAPLQTFDVGGVDEELGTVGLEELYRLCCLSALNLSGPERLYGKKRDSDIEPLQQAKHVP